MRGTMKLYYFRGKQGGIADAESTDRRRREQGVPADREACGLGCAWDGGCRSCRERDRGVGKNKRISPGYRDHGYPDAGI